MCGIFLARLLNSGPLQRLRELWLRFLEWTILFFLHCVDRLQLHVGRLGNLGINFLFIQFVSGNAFLLRFHVDDALSN